jgi:hypothetical protein
MTIFFQDEHGWRWQPGDVAAESFDLNPICAYWLPPLRMHSARCALRTWTKGAGLVHVHFPRIGHCSQI